jgi:hypothetical protein
MISMEQISGFYKILAKAAIQQQLSKHFLGKPYLRFGQCFVLYSYFFELGAILGAKYHNKPEEFGLAFLGLTGESGALTKFFFEIEKLLRNDFNIESMKFSDYISSEYKKRIGYSGDDAQFTIDYFIKKVSPETAYKDIWQYAVDGAALGIKNPDLIRRMHKHSYIPTPKEKWDLVRRIGPSIPHLANSIGMDLPPAEDLLTYDEAEEAVNGLFMIYCKEICPDLLNVLTK